MGFTITVAEITAFLISKGYRIETGKGRHGTKAVRDGHRISIPTHPGDIAKGTAKEILKQAGYTINDVMAWRRG
jgi:predicted RNA binding protein YcfA (HicA-like mRNA interferase family)